MLPLLQNSGSLSEAPQGGRIGPYVLIRRIGRGGMSDVWLGVNRLHSTTAAVKILNQRLDLGDTNQRLLREVRAVAGLSHPGVVDILDFGVLDVSQGRRESAGLPWLAMEYAPHGDLSMAPRPMPWPALRRVLLHLLDALAHAHARHIVHLDIKPANVLVRRDGHGVGLLLTDFGLAHFSAPEPGQPGVPLLAGTPHYMSPEQLRGLWRRYGPWTDLYALGCMAYELATGRLPFDGGSAVLIARQHISDPVPELPARLDLPKPFGHWLKRLLAKDPDDRFERAADAAFHLARISPPTPKAEREALREVFTPEGAHTEDEELLSLVLSGAPIPGVEGITGTRGGQTLASLVTMTTMGNGRALPVAHAGLVDARRGLMEVLPPHPISWRGADTHQAHVSTRGLSLFGLRSVPLMGRIPERNHLWSALRWVRGQGRSRMICVEGPVGCGKSALVRWLCERAEELGAAYAIRATHSPAPGRGDGVPRALARWLRCQGAERAEIREELLGQLSWLAPEMGGADRMALAEALSSLMTPSEGEASSAARGMQRYRALGEWLALMGRRRPVILWLDEVQWGADALRLTRYLLSAECQVPVLVVATLGAGAHAETRIEADLIEGLASSPQVERLPIGRLNRGMMTLMLQDGLGLSGDTAEALLDQAEGSTLYAMQAVADWVGRGILMPGARGYEVPPRAISALPRGLGTLSMKRLRWVARQCPDPEGCMQALEVAAALGRSLHVRTLAMTCRRMGLTLPQRLSRLILDAGLVRGGVGQWLFAYEGLVEALLERARAGGRLQEIHRACADTLDSLSRRDRCEFRCNAARQAYHLVGAGRWDEALEMLRISIEGWLTTGDHVRSIACLESFQGILAGEAEGMAHLDERRVWMLSRLAESYHHLGQHLESELTRQRLARAVAQHGQPRGKAALLRLEAMAALASGEIERAHSAYLEASELYRALPDPAGAVRCMRGEGWILLSLGQHAQARALFARGRELGEAHGALPLEVAWCRQGEAAALVWGELPEAEAVIAHALDEFRALGAINGVASTRLLLANLAWGAGDLAEAVQLMEGALGCWSETGSQHISSGLLHLAMIWMEAGAHPQAQSLLIRLTEDHLEGLSHRWRTVAWVLLARAHAELEEIEGARMAAARGWRVFQACGVHPHPGARRLLEVSGRRLKALCDGEEGAWALRVAAACWLPYEPSAAAGLELEADL